MTSKQPAYDAPSEHYRIKPDERKFKVGDWVRQDNIVFQVEWVSFNGHDVGTIRKKEPNKGCVTSYTRDVKLWQPQEGDEVIGITSEDIVTIGIVYVCTSPSLKHYNRLCIHTDIELSVFKTVIPYIGQPLEEMK